MASSKIAEGWAPRKMARVTGALYLAYVVASVVASLLAHIGIGNADDIYGSINNHLSMFRAGLVVALLSGLLFLLAAWGLYVLLRAVNTQLALLFLLLNLVGVGIQCTSMFPLVSAMLLGDGVSQMQTYSAGQVEGLSYLAIDLYKTGFVTAQLFFSAWLFPLGYLVYKSRLLPRALGALLLLDGVGVFVWFLQGLVWPSHTVLKYPGLVVGFVAEVGLALWLLIMSVKVAAQEDKRFQKVNAGGLDG